MPPHERTDENARLVEILTAAGEDQPTIADFLGITRWTLRKYYRDELDNGAARFLAKLKVTALSKALAGDPQMLRFVLNVRSGWREQSKTELTGKDGAALNVGLYPVLDLSALSDKELEQYVALEAKCRQQPAQLTAGQDDALDADGAEAEGVGET